MGKRYLSPINTKSMVQIVIDRISGAIIDGELVRGIRFQQSRSLVPCLM